MKLFYRLFVVLFLSQNAIYGQLNVSSGLKLAVEKAIEKDLSLKNTSLDIEKIALNREELLDKYIPRLEATSILALYDNSVTLDIPTATLPITGIRLFDGKTTLDNKGKIFRSELKLSSVLYAGNQIRNGAKALEKKEEATAYLLEADKDKLAKNVIKSFDELFLIKSAEELLNQINLRLQKERERLEKAIKNGVAVPYDRDKIKLAQLELASRGISLKDSKELLFRKIGYLTGYSPSQIETVVYELIPYELFEKELSTENKQELQALQSFKEALEFIAKKEKGANLPKIGTFAALTYTDFFDATVSVPTSSFSNSINTRVNQFSIGPNWIVGLGLKWELFSGFERKNKMTEAAINIEQMQNKIDDTKQQLQLLMKNSISNYEASLQQIEIAKQRKKIAQNNLNLATKQYHEGIITIIDKIAAENDVYQTSLENVQNIIHQRQAALDVLIATGTLMKQLQKN